MAAGKHDTSTIQPRKIKTTVHHAKNGGHPKTGRHPQPRRPPYVCVYIYIKIQGTPFLTLHCKTWLVKIKSENHVEKIITSPGAFKPRNPCPLLHLQKTRPNPWLTDRHRWAMMGHSSVRPNPKTLEIFTHTKQPLCLLDFCSFSKFPFAAKLAS